MSMASHRQKQVHTLSTFTPRRNLHLHRHSTIIFGPPGPSQYINDTYLPSTASTTITVQESTNLEQFPTAALQPNTGHAQ